MPEDYAPDAILLDDENDGGRKKYLYEDDEEDRPRRKKKPRRRRRRVRNDGDFGWEEVSNLGYLLTAIGLLSFGVLSLLLVIFLVFIAQTHYLIGTPIGLICLGVGYRMLVNR